MGKAIGVGGDLDDFISHHPAEQIDVVDALIHQRAPVLIPSAPPFGLIIVALIPVPSDVGGAVVEPAEAPGLQSFPDFSDGGVEPVLMAGAELDALLPGGEDEPVCVL